MARVNQKENNGHVNFKPLKREQKSIIDKKTDPFERLFVTETNKIKKNNIDKILAYELEKSSSRFRSDFLRRHEINPEIRARMVDWMIEVLSSFSCTTNTFFVALDIMDSFLGKCKRRLSIKDIHIVGVTSMLLASKMEEIIPFKVSTVVDKMTHGKIGKEEIVKMEMEIL